MITIDERQGELQRQLGAATSMVKVVMGVANGCATAIMMDCFSEISGKAIDRHGNRKPPHPKYKHKVKQAYKQAVDGYTNMSVGCSTPRPTDSSTLPTYHQITARYTATSPMHSSSSSGRVPAQRHTA